MGAQKEENKKNWENSLHNIRMNNNDENVAEQHKLQ